RRHTRSKRDWSSDVCSSDLGLSVDNNAIKFFRNILFRIKVPKVDKKGHSAVSPVVIPLVLKLRSYIRFTDVTALNDLYGIGIVDKCHLLIIVNMFSNQPFIIRHITG